MRPPLSASKPQPQPKTVKLSWKALLSFPYRMCNPPPAVGRVRSLQVTPIVDVKLDDVLNRTHLPPLGLKDFEEWLLFVERCPENLYFLLWLKEYTTRYDQWVTSAKQSRGPSSSTRSEKHRVPNPLGWPATNHSLAIFYARAKQTFFTPNSVYELNLPSEILGPFHASAPAEADFSTVPPLDAFSPHPDPAVFNEVVHEIRLMLEESLERFVKATFNNVGTNRAICGLVGGIVIALLGSVPPVTVNFMSGRDRWLRVLALPGLWLGLTIVLASLHGVCMMIYVFGDLRQLRSFELSRPAISSPQPLRNDTSWFRIPPPRKHHTTPVSISPPGTIPITRPPINIPKSVYIAPPVPQLRIGASPQLSGPAVCSPRTPTNPITPVSPAKPRYHPRYASAHTLGSETPHLSFPSSSSVASASSNNLQHTGSSSDGEHAIHISEAYYDETLPYTGDEPISSPVPSSWVSPSPDPVRSPMFWEASPEHRLSNPIDRLRTGAQPRSDTESESDIWTSTASFIHPYEYARWDEDFRYDGGDEESQYGARVHTRAASRDMQPVDAFDFDALPALKLHAGRPRFRKCDASVPPPIGERGGPRRRGAFVGPKDFIRRFQGRCAAVKGVVRTVLSWSAEGNRQLPEYRDDDHETQNKQTQTVPQPENEKTPDPVASRFKKVSMVPAFRSPLTKILSPVVSRAQWEIVVRSALWAMLISCILLAALVAAPILH